MLSDLQGKGAIERDADFVIIGGGTVGLPTGVLLAQRTGKTILCLETGGLEQLQDTHPLNEVVHHGTRYRGAEDGRFRCLGGTSTRWGGALIPFQAPDIEIAGWPIDYEELISFVPDVERLFKLEKGSYADEKFPFLLGEDFSPRLAKWPAFANRNTSSLLKEDIRLLQNFHVWLNAHAVEIKSTVGGVRINARSCTGDSIVVTAKKLIVAAGAIETTRLALLIDQQNENAVSSATPHLGRWFTDHISAEVATVENPNLRALNEILGFRFGPVGSMRNIRFELTPQTPLRKDLPPSFTHVYFKTDEQSGFDALRAIFRALQRGKLPKARECFTLLKYIPWLWRAVYWRFVKRRLLYPENSKLIVHTVVEQRPESENCITLSTKRRDLFGVPLAEVTWKVSDTDKRNVLEYAAKFAATWSSTGFSNLGVLKPIPPELIWSNLDSSEGIFHPTGSTRMGTSPAEGAVDANLSLFGISNVQLLATSVLPTGGGANPTMMLLLLAMRCVAQHERANLKLEMQPH